MRTFVLNVPLPEPKFWRRHYSTGLEKSSYMKFFPMFPSLTKSWRRPSIEYILYIYMLSLVQPPPILYVADPMDKMVLIYKYQY